MYTNDPSGKASPAPLDAPKSENNVNRRAFRPLSEMPSIGTSPEDGEPEGNGHFFGLHHPTFYRACVLGINHAISYLIMARGTQADNRTTTWSTNSIEQKTRISRKKARVCSDEMLAAGILIPAGGSSHRPIRTLFLEPDKLFADRMGNRVENSESAILQQLPLEADAQSEDSQEALKALEAKGLTMLNEGEWGLGQGVNSIRQQTELTWLPNSIVDGIFGQNSPCELIRQTQDVWLLCLLVTLYRYHELTFSQGLPPCLLCQTYSRRHVAEFRNLDLYEFASKDLLVDPRSGLVLFFGSSGSAKPADEQFWDRFTLLQTLGLVNFVPHLLDGPEGETMFPIIQKQDGNDATPAEGDLFDAIGVANLAMARSKTGRHMTSSLDKLFVFVPNHIRKVQVRGIARLRHRPRTKVTSEWLSQSDSLLRWAEYYRKLAADIRANGARR